MGLIYRHTRVYKVNGTLVVGDSIHEVVDIFRSFDSSSEIVEIRLISGDHGTELPNTALIATEGETEYEKADF